MSARVDGVEKRLDLGSEEEFQCLVCSFPVPPMALD